MADSPSSSGRDSRESGEWLRRALSAGRLGTWQWDIKSGKVAWSRETLAIFGIREFGGDYAAWLRLVHPGDAELAKACIERALRKGEDEFLLEHRSILPDGRVVWVEGRGQVQRDEHGEPLAIIGVVQDITRRKELELQLAQSQRLETGGRGGGALRTTSTTC